MWCCESFNCLWYENVAAFRHKLWTYESFLSIVDCAVAATLNKYVTRGGQIIAK